MTATPAAFPLLPDIPDTSLLPARSRGLVCGSVACGVGKTTIVTSIMGALRVCGLAVRFPDRFAAERSANRATQAAFRRATTRRAVLHGEHGELVDLGTALTDASGQRHPIAGLLPITILLRGPRRTLANHELGPLVPTSPASAGTLPCVHECSWSMANRQPSADQAVYAVGDPPRLEGFRRGSVLSSYARLHFATHSGIAPAFVQAATKGWR